MDHLSKEEAENELILLPRETVLRARLRLLKPGEMLKLYKEEWHGTGKPFDVASRLARSLGWKFESGYQEDSKGWKFRRVK